MEQLELMCMRHADRHSSSQRSVLQGMTTTTIQRVWRRRGDRLTIQNVSTTKLLQSTSQVVRGFKSFFKSSVQQAIKVITRACDAPAFALGTVATMTHFISVSRQLQQQIKVWQQMVISLQTTVHRCLVKSQQNCSAKGWRYCVSLTDRMIQDYTLVQLVKCSRWASTLQSACESVTGMSSEWVLIATCKQLVWSTRIVRNRYLDPPIPGVQPFAHQASTSRLPEPTPLTVYRTVPQVPPPLHSSMWLHKCSLKNI